MRYDSEVLKRFVLAVLSKAGIKKDEAEILTDSLIYADLRGINSHGISKLGIYMQRIEAGVVELGAEPEILAANESVITVDGHNGIGASIGIKVMDLCLERASKYGCCFATVKNGTHFGTGAYFTNHAAYKNMIGIAVCNSEAGVVPTGGARAMLGTNPLSVAIPAGKHPPLILDMATSTAALGKVRLAQKEGKTIPEGWAVDKYGNLTTDPHKVLNGGAMLAFGGPKGYALGLIIEILCSCLGGALDSRRTYLLREDFEHSQNVGYFMGAFDIDKFLPFAEFIAKTDFMLDEFKNCPPAPGIKEVLLPGEIEHNTYLANLREGIPISETIKNDLIVVAEKYAIRHPF